MIDNTLSHEAVSRSDIADGALEHLNATLGAEVVSGALDFRSRHEPDMPRITDIGVFTWHQRADYDAVSVITRESDSVLRATSVKFPIGTTVIVEDVEPAETHLFNIQEGKPLFMTKPGESLLRPFRILGRAAARHQAA